MKIEDIQKESVIITVTFQGYIKRGALSNVKKQKRGGKSTGSFSVTLYEGSRKLDEYLVQQGIGSFDSVPVIFNIENPKVGPLSLKVNVDYLEQTEDFLRENNKIELLLIVGEKTSSNSNGEDGDGAVV